MSDHSGADPLSILSGHITGLVDRTAARVVAVHGRKWVRSSGILWRPGVIVTADETLERDEDLAVMLPDGRSVGAALIGRDPSTDLAVLRVEEGGSGLAEIEGAAPVRTGAVAIAVGRREEGPVASLGLVGFAGAAWRSRRGGRIDQRIELDLRLDPRAEGGAVVDASGGLIGMAVFGPRRRVLVIPAPTLERGVEQLLAHGRVARGYLGAGLQPIRLDPDLMQTIGRPHDRAAIVVSIDPQGPAKAAGLLIGDVITAWAGDPIRGVRDVMARLGPDSVGQTVELALVRAGAAASVSVTIGERPSA
jgi:S1-C subfamily serine protease